MHAPKEFWVDKWKEQRKYIMRGGCSELGGHWRGLSGEERIRGRFPSSLLSPSQLSAWVPLGCNKCSHPAVILELLLEKVGLCVRPSQDSGWEDCDKEYSLTSITSWRFGYVPPHRCLITLQWKNQQDDGIFPFPLLPSFLWGLDLVNNHCASRLVGDDQDPQCLPQERTTGGTHLQRWACENSRMFSPSTFCDLLHVDAKSFEWRASQGRFIRRAEGTRRKRRGCTHTDHFSHLANNIDFCPCCYLMFLDLTRHWKSSNGDQEVVIVSLASDCWQGYLRDSLCRGLMPANQKRVEKSPSNGWPRFHLEVVFETTFQICWT